MTERLTVRDCLRAGYCRRGIREKCQLFALDFATFYREGIPLAEAEAIDDFHIQCAVAVAKKRIAKG